MAALVPPTARRVLDVGCGAGRLGELLKRRQTVHVTGLELDPGAAAAARTRLDEVIESDVDRNPPEFPDASFDCIVCADVLEHLLRPERFLEKARRWLSPDGVLVASLPNVQHHSVVAALLAGNFTYEPAGLLDHDHVRLLTRSEIEKLLYRAGFDIQTIQTVPGPGYDEWKAQGSPARVQVGRLAINTRSAAEAEAFFAYQYLVAARPSARPDYGLTSIVILTHNELAYTRQCLDSIRFLTDEPYELILVDNGSTDGTLEYLRSLSVTLRKRGLAPGSCASPSTRPQGRGCLSPFPDALSDIVLIENAENRGFPAAANQGIQAARGDNILLLNNDVLVTTGWLRRLLDALYSDPQIGLAGPLSNNVSGEQQIPVDYQSLAELDGFAWRLAQQRRARHTDTNRLVGFCLLMKREVVDRVGLLDEQFGIGCFEDDDFCRRALAAGYRAVIAEDAFIHHFGSTTFRASAVDFAAVMAENQRKYARKWSRPEQAETPNSIERSRARDSEQQQEVRNGRRAAPPPASRQWEADSALIADPHTNLQRPAGLVPVDAMILRESSAPLAQGRRGPQHLLSGASLVQNHRPTGTSPVVIAPGGRFSLDADRARPATPNRGPARAPDAIRLSLCMIVRDNEGTIEACLNSIRPWVDEMVVIDTGSTDSTPEICRRLGARMFEFPWCDDFSAARNESIRHARGEWIFWMDSDDTIDEENGRKLRELADSDHAPEVLGYVVQVHCPAPGRTGPAEVTVVDHVKLFRNRPDLRFEFCIHEQIIPAIRRAGGEVGRTDLYVVHSGADHTPAGRQRKLERDFRLLAKDLAQRPDHPFVLFNLGMTLNDAGRHDKAVESLRRSIEVSQPTESHVRKAYALLAGSLAEGGRREEALAACTRGLELFPDDKELLFRSAALYHHLGRLAEAERLYLRVLTEPEAWHFTSIDRGLAGYKARHNLARVYEDMGRLDKAEEQWRAVVTDQPHYRDGWRGLGEILLQQEKLPELANVIRQLQSDEHLRVIGHVLAALRARREEDPAAARRELERALQHSPDDVDIQHQLCRVLFESFDPYDAEPGLRRLAEMTPEDAAVHHNLGAICRRARRHEEAIGCYRNSLALRPNSPRTWLELGRTLRDSGRRKEARRAWQSGIEIDPDNSALRQELEKSMSTSNVARLSES